MKAKALIGTGVLFAALLATVGIATATPGASGKELQIQLFDPNGPFSQVVDAGARGFGAGDAIVESHTVLDATTGKRVGTATTHVAIVRKLAKGDFLGIIDCTIGLKDGRIVFYGAFRGSDLARGVTLPITGGTGTYVGTHGIVTAQQRKLAGRAGTRLVFELTTPS